MNTEDIKNLISNYFGTNLKIIDAVVNVESDDGHHFAASITTNAFNGKSLLQRQRMVYEAVGTQLKDGDIHALGLKTYTHEEWHKKEQK